MPNNFLPECSLEHCRKVLHTSFKIEIKIERNTFFDSECVVNHCFLPFWNCCTIHIEKDQFEKHAFCILKCIFSLKTQKIFRLCWNSHYGVLCDFSQTTHVGLQEPNVFTGNISFYFYAVISIKKFNETVTQWYVTAISTWSENFLSFEVEYTLQNANYMLWKFALFVGNSRMICMLWKYLKFNTPVIFPNFLSNWVNLLGIFTSCEKLRAFERNPSFWNNYLMPWRPII